MYRHFLKRLIGFCVAFVVLLCISLLLIVVAVGLYFANKKYITTCFQKGDGKSRWQKWLETVIFMQERPGKDGKIFRVIKFKTMTDERDADGNLLPDEERLTKIGRFIRST